MSDLTPDREKDSLINAKAFIADNSRDLSRSSQQAEDTDLTLKKFQVGEFNNWQLSGLFTVPSVDLPLTMFLYVSSLINAAETVQLQVNAVTESGKNMIVQTAVIVPAQGAVQIRFDVGALGLMGKTVEVLLRSAEYINIFQLFPSVNIVETFPADGATLPLLFLPPSGFQQVLPFHNDNSISSLQQENSSLEEPLPPILLTTGVLEVPQGVFAVRPQVELVLSSFFDETLTADVVVNTLVRGTTSKEQVLSETVAVPPMEARQLVINNVEGLPIEINLTLSRTVQGRILQPAVNVTNVFMVAESVDLVMFLPPGKFMGIFTEDTAALHLASTGRSRSIQRNVKKGGL